MVAQVDAGRLRLRAHRGGRRRAGIDAQRVEERVVALRHAERLQAAGQRARQPVHAQGDLAQPAGAVVRRVHAGDVGQQRLRRADVRRRPFAPDVLLARLQRHPQGRASPGVDGHADHPPRQLARGGAAGREERGVRPAVARRDAEALRAADHHVGPRLPRRRQQRERQQVRRHDDLRARGVRPRRDRGQVVEAARGVGRLHQHADQVVRSPGGPRRADVGHLDLDAQRLGPPPHDRDGLGKTFRRDQEAPRVRAPPRLQAAQHGQRLGRRGGLVEQRGVGDLHPGQVRDGGLKGQQRLQPALRDLGLVRRVGGVPAGVFEQVAADHGRRDAAVVAEPDERPPGRVAVGQPAHPGQEGRLRLRLRQVGEPRQADAGGDRLVHQGVERRRPDHLQHAVDVRRARPDVAVRESGGRVSHAGLSRRRRRARRRPPRPAGRRRRRDRPAPARSSRPRADPG